MSIKDRIFVIMGVALAALYVVAAVPPVKGWVDGFCLDFLFAYMNELKNHVEIPSPGKNVIVDSYNIYGSAISDDVTQIVIRPRIEPFDSQNNFCLLSIDGLKKTKVTWISDNNLSIQYEPGTVYVAAPKWKDVSITYSELK